MFEQEIRSGLLVSHRVQKESYSEANKNFFFFFFSFFLLQADCGVFVRMASMRQF